MLNHFKQIFTRRHKVTVISIIHKWLKFPLQKVTEVN